MELVVLSIHLLVCVCLIGLVLLQRSEGGALGMGGGGGGALMSGRGAADALARMTSIAGGFFLVTSLGLTALSGAAASTDGSSILDLIPRQERLAPAPAAAPSEPARPDPTESSVPELAETQLASMSTPAIEAAPIPAAAVAPPPVVASTRAAPISARQATPTSTRPAQTTPTPRAATTVPVSTGQPRVQPPATQRPAVVTQAPATQRSGAEAIPTNATRPATTRTLILPNTSGGGTNGQPLTAPTAPESVEVVDGVEAVRRERAGPDQ